MNGVDRTKARRLTRVGQAAALLLAGGAVMAFVVEPSLPPAPQIVQAPAPTWEREEPQPAPIDFDIALVSEMLNLAGEVDPKYDVTAPPDDPVEPPPTETQVTRNTTSNFRFLGGFFSPKRSLAIIAGAGKQRMVRVGDEIDFGFTVTSITPETVEIERNGEVEQLQREIASGAVIAKTIPAVPGSEGDRLAPGTEVSGVVRDRLAEARKREAMRRAEADRSSTRAEYERQRQQRIEELREQGIDVDDMEWRQDD